MQLTPHDILKHLGFSVPEEGISINPDDAFLVTETLRLMGATVDVARVSDADLCDLHHGMVGLVESWSASGQIAPIDVRQGELDTTSLMKLRATLDVLFSHTVGVR